MVKYLSRSERGWEFDPYFDYLETVRGSMPVSLFEFASNYGNYDLESPNSLHDSWLEHVCVAEPTTIGNNTKRSLQIDMRLLGSRHDRYINLTYKNVDKYHIHGPGEIDLIPRHIPHGDLLIHELIVVRQGLFSHELVFSKGAVFVIEFTEFEHHIEMSNQ